MYINPLTLFSVVKQSCSSGDFLGFVSWYHYLDRTPDGCDIETFQFFPDGTTPSDVPLVLIAVIDDLLRLAGIIAVAFVLVGAVQYIASQGNSEDTSKAQSTILNALIGLAIAVVAVAFVSFLGNKLGK
ncbi:MAG: hypothetical protein JWO35_75 [Candidatus Saccharibacteria bacterium]|nr:hypothetical protein [Candidatus Saccharibacteria bacterium]